MIYRILALLLVCSCVHAADVTLKSLDQTYFLTNGSALPSVSIKGNLTNWAKLTTNSASTVSGANPTASVGLSAVNGSATTYLRSDGAPALDQTIVPTWTGLHTWTAKGIFTNATSGTVLSLQGNSANTWLFNWLVGGVSSGGITNDGSILIGRGTASAPSLAFAADADGSGTGIYSRGANAVDIAINGVGQVDIANNSLQLISSGIFGWSSGSIGASFDTQLTREAAAVIQAGADAASTVAQTFKGPDGSGTDIAGGTLTIGGGNSTGTGRGGAVQDQVSNSATSTSSSANGAVIRRRVEGKHVNLTESTATSVVNLSLTPGNWIGVRMFATTEAGDGTDFQATTDEFVVSAVNKGGTITTSVSSSLTGSAVSTGTLTTAWTATATGNFIDIKCNAVSSLTQTILRTRLQYEINCSTQTTITPQ